MRKEATLEDQPHRVGMLCLVGRDDVVSVLEFFGWFAVLIYGWAR